MLRPQRWLPDGTDGVGCAMHPLLGRKSEHPAWVDAVGVGQRAAVRLGPPLVEAVDLTPPKRVAEFVLRDAPQRVVADHDVTPDGPFHATRPATPLPVSG